jgi:hypothetical protein
VAIHLPLFLTLEVEALILESKMFISAADLLSWVNNIKKVPENFKYMENIPSKCFFTV